MDKESTRDGLTSGMMTGNAPPPRDPMMLPVRCPHCRNLSRVAADAVGGTVACPHCGHTFAAEPVSLPARAWEGGSPPATPTLPRKGGGGPEKPLVARRAGPRPAPPTRDDMPVHYPPAYDDAAALGLDDPPPAGPSPALVGLVLLPLGIPLFWLIGPALTGVEPVFSYAAPVALAIGLCGLGLGVAFAHGWTTATRVKAVLALVMIGYFTGGFLFFLKKEWAEAARRHVGPGGMRWRQFEPPHDRQAYRVRLPGKMNPLDDHAALPGWGLKAYRLARETNAQATLAVAYEVAHGTPPENVAGRDLADEDWFARVREAVCRGCGGVVARERAVHNKDHPGREYVLTLPDRATNRIVRVFRAGDRAFYLAVEGAFVPDDAGYVRDFFESFLIDPR
jgi:hypothetical protein